MREFDLDALIEDTVIEAELGAGTDRRWLAKHADPRKVSVLARGTEESGKPPPWTEEEEQFVRDNVLRMSDDEIGAALGRTGEAVHVRRERHLRLPARTNTDGWPTMRQVGLMLGMCGKAVHRQIVEGRLPGYRLPVERTIIVVPRPAVERFAINPMNWLYFDRSRVTDPRIRRFIHLREERWNDDWWTVGQVAAYHGVSLSAVSQRIRRGQLPAVMWQNRMILRSDALRVSFAVGKGNAETWTPAQDRYVVRSKAVGLSYRTIQRMSKLQSVGHRVVTLARQGNLSSVASQVGAQCDGNNLYADFRDFLGEFPMIERAAQKLVDGDELDKYGTSNLLGVFASWVTWHDPSDEGRKLAQRLTLTGNCSTSYLVTVYDKLVKMGFQSFK